MPTFLPGRALAAAFYLEAIQPAIADVPHAAALLGWGSDVLGYDTVRSIDHGWGPRLQLFTQAADVADVTNRIIPAMPESFRGWPTRFGWDNVAPRHWVEVSTATQWIADRLGYVPDRSMSIIDWLVTPQQRLLEVVGGEIFRDDTGELTEMRRLLEWYPHQLWVWLIACQWQRISQEEAFVGRCAEVGDELGSRTVGAGLVRDLMRLAFLLERRYAPYTKWLGTAFETLDVAGEVGDGLERALGAPDYAGREAGLADAYEGLARRHNSLALTAPVDPATRPYHGRPFRVLHAERFVAACLDQIDDSDLRELPLVGAVDQLVDSADVLSQVDRTARLRSFYMGVDRAGG